jgi:hypothetical protein
MKRLFILNLIFFIVSISGITIFVDCVQASPGPQIFIKEGAFDAGNIKQGDIISHTFIVANQGDEKLLIEKVQPG